MVFNYTRMDTNTNISITFKSFSQQASALKLLIILTLVSVRQGKDIIDHSHF